MGSPQRDGFSRWHEISVCSGFCDWTIWVRDNHQHRLSQILENWLLRQGVKGANIL